MFLAEDVTQGVKHNPCPTSWEGISPERGKLFVVGDPKQSIYRFRRADVEQMRRLQERMEQTGGQTVSLVQNFRSQRPVTDWVNHLFARWMGEGDPGDGAGYVQADYEAMTPRWQATTESPLGPRVWALSDGAVDSPINDIRQEEASDIAALLQQIVSQGWQVLDRESTEESGGEAYRAATYSDICILMPARTGLPALERALEARDIPFRLESASLVFETQEIRDLMNCLKAIDDPADQVATVAALRSVAFGCSDADLFRHHEAGGRFDCLAVPPDGAFDTVSEALSELRRFHQDRLWQSAAYLIDRFVRERRLMEAASWPSPDAGAVAPLPVHGGTGLAVRRRRRRLPEGLNPVGGEPDGRGSAGHRVAGSRVGRGIGASDDHSCRQGTGVPGGGADRHQLRPGLTRGYSLV